MSSGSSLASPVNFARPPVVEVACTVQFANPVMEEQRALNRFWPRIRDHFPQLVMQPALPPMSEEFGPAPAVTFQLMGPNQPTRYWMMSDDQREVVQVQADRLAFNWRKEPEPGGPTADYPRYPFVRERFAEVLGEFLAVAEEVGKSVVPDMCEIAYINQIPAVTESGDNRPLSSILRLLTEVSLRGLPDPEDSAFAQRYPLTRDGTRYGRFHINTNAAYRLPTQELIYVVTMIVRGLPPGGGQDDVLRFMDDGRDLIVNAFRDATTDDMHDEWGLE